MQQIRKERQSGFEWYNSKATPEQRKLSDRIHDLSVYFEDMRFEQGTPTHELMKCQAYDEDAEEWEDYYLDPPDEVAFFNYAWFAYTVEPQDDCDGYFNPATQELCITPDYLDDDPTVLHEMIHLHEYVYDCAPGICHDMAFWGLYSTLREKIPKLDEIISTHACMLVQETLYKRGGEHDILFFLKSLDLDIRMGYPLGTVCSYGKSDELKGYTYTAETSDSK